MVLVLDGIRENFDHVNPSGLFPVDESLRSVFGGVRPLRALV